MHHEANGYAGNATYNRISGQLDSKPNSSSDLGIVGTDCFI